MIRRAAPFCALFSLIFAARLGAQEAKPPAPRRITLEEAVQLALKHNHIVRIAAFGVQEKEHTKDIARSAYYPILRNDSNVAHLTDTQFIGIPAGGLGVVGGTLLPERSIILNQGGHTLITSGTSLTQPLSELWKIKSANDVASAELTETRSKAHQTENEVALRVHQLYYRILVLQSHKEAAGAKIHASDALQAERVQQVKFGSTLEEEAIESRAQSLEAKQDLLTTELQLSDLTMQLDDAIGLPFPLSCTGALASVTVVGETFLASNVGVLKIATGTMLLPRLMGTGGAAIGLMAMVTGIGVRSAMRNGDRLLVCPQNASPTGSFEVVTCTHALFSK